MMFHVKHLAIAFLVALPARFCKALARSKDGAFIEIDVYDGAYLGHPSGNGAYAARSAQSVEPNGVERYDRRRP